VAEYHSVSDGIAETFRTLLARHTRLSSRDSAFSYGVSDAEQVPK